MDAQAIRQLEPQLNCFLKQFSDCLDEECEFYGITYIRGQLSDLERKNVERIALAADLSPRTLQEFLASYEWDHQAMRAKLLRIVAEQHPNRNSIGIIDETSFPKKGIKTPGVQRQHCGALGKQDNCFVTVHLSYASEDFHCLLDGDLFLPESWSNDRERCRAAKIPDHVVYRSKADIALELINRANVNGVRLQWLTFDEWYGAKPAFLSALCRRQQKYVGETHCDHRLWTKEPRQTNRPYRKNSRGKSKKTPRLVAGSPSPLTAQQCLEIDPMFTRQAWQRWHVKDTEKGAKVVEVRHCIVYPQDENKLPMQAHHLLIVRDVLTQEIKYFLSNAPANTSVGVLLKVAFSRWRVERCFEDEKSYVGLDHYQGRGYPGLLRHLILRAVSLLFLSESRKLLQREYPELTVSQVRQAMSSLVQSWWLAPLNAETLIEQTARRLEYYQRRNMQARISHSKTKQRQLIALGIDVELTPKCEWDSG